MVKNNIIKKLFNNTLNEPFIVVEISGNHGQSIKNAKKLIKEISNSGAHAVKFQTYTPDTMTFNLKKKEFLIKNKKSPWYGKYLYDLYKKAYTPWEWHKELFNYANKLGLICFSSVFDDSSINFLETLKNPIYKISSFENTDLELIKKAALTKKPVIISSGLASYKELNDAVKILKKYGSGKYAILKCTSSYPAKAEDSNLLTISDISRKFRCIAGLSDHTKGIEVAIGSVAIGAKIIEKHVKLEKDKKSVDNKFAITTKQLKELVKNCKSIYKAKGKVFYGPTKPEIPYLKSRRTLYYNNNLSKNQKLKKIDLKRARPGIGLSIKNIDKIVGKKLRKNVKIGMPASSKDFY